MPHLLVVLRDGRDDDEEDGVHVSTHGVNVLFANDLQHLRDNIRAVAQGGMQRGNDQDADVTWSSRPQA